MVGWGRGWPGDRVGVKTDSPITWLAASGLFVVLDQLSKHMVIESLALYERVELLPVLSLIRLHNSGMAFGLFNLPGGAQLWIITPLSIIVSLYLIRELLLARAPDLWRTLAFSLVLAGALGNLIDRITLGYVVDFVLMHAWNWSFPAYNLADTCITFGVACWLWSLFTESRDGRHAGGFTLVEVMVVILIVALLAFLTVPLYVGFTDRAERTAAEGDLFNCGAGLERMLLDQQSLQVAADGDGDGIGESSTGPVSVEVCSPRSTRYSIEIEESSDDYFVLAAIPDPDSELLELRYDAWGVTSIDLNRDGDFDDEGEDVWH